MLKSHTHFIYNIQYRINICLFVFLLSFCDWNMVYQKIIIKCVSSEVHNIEIK